MKTFTLPSEFLEIANTIQMLKVMIDEQVPSEALVEVGVHLADLLSQHGVQGSHPAVYEEIRELLIAVFRVAAGGLRDEAGAPTEICHDIETSLDRAQMILALAATARQSRAA